MAVTNVMEQMVSTVLVEYKRHYPLACECEQCMDDILALALNHLPPRYASTDTGNLLIKTFSMDQQIRLDILKEIQNAVDKVSSKPRHAINNET